MDKAPGERPTDVDLDRQSTLRKFSILNELYVELLGTLIPGLFMVIPGAIIVILTAATIYQMVFGFGPVPIGVALGAAIKLILEHYHYEIALITLVSSYVIGSILFRQDPKRPDATSALYVWMTSSPDDRSGLASQSRVSPCQLPKGGFSLWDRITSFLRPKRFIRRYRLDTQFPYLDLRCYLGARGLTHLTNLVPWCPNVPDFEANSSKLRTKMFINILKIRLQSLIPEVCRDIVRNEAHVRLATSVWYAATSLLTVAALCLFGLLFTAAFEIGKQYLMGMLYVPVCVNGLIALVCVIMKYELRKCIHYMRVREVIYVLEASHLASTLVKDFRIEEVTAKGKLEDCASCPRVRSFKIVSHEGTTSNNGLHPM